MSLKAGLLLNGQYNGGIVLLHDSNPVLMSS